MGAWLWGVILSTTTTLMLLAAATWLMRAWLKKRLRGAIEARYGAELEMLKNRMRSTEEELKRARAEVSANATAVREVSLAARSPRNSGLIDSFATLLERYFSKRFASSSVGMYRPKNSDAPHLGNSAASARESITHYEGIEQRIARLEDTRTNPNGTTNFLTGVLAVITLCGVAVSYFQWKTAQAFFYKDERPYVMVNPEPLTFMPNSPIRVNMYSGNPGKSPAVEVHGDGRIFLGDDALKQADTWFAAENLRPDNKKGVVIPPSVSASNHADAIHATLSTGRVIGADEFKAITAKDFSIVVVYREMYQDTFGNTYKTDVCFAYLVSNAIADCPKHNRIE
jgi:hypothetical protein